MILLFSVIILLFLISIPEIFAEKTITIQKIVDIDKKSLTDSLSSLELYSQIFPNYIKQSKPINNDIVKMKIGTSLFKVDANVKYTGSNSKSKLEIISGDFKGTKIYVIMSELKQDSKKLNDLTKVRIKVDLETNWIMTGIILFASDDDIKHALYSNLDTLVKYSKNPTIQEIVFEEEDKFCIFNLCF